MPVNAVAENIFGTMGAILWSVQLIPQLVKSWRTKSTKGLSPLLPLMWSMAALPLGIYVIVQDLNVPLIVQPQLFALFTLLSWTQCMYYGRARSRAWCAAVLAATLVLYAALEAGMVFALRPSYRRGTSAGKAGVRFFGILSSALISLALLPQYYEIYKHGAVVGISLTFMAVDLLGGVASILSLAFKSHFDTTAAVAYALVVVMDGLVLVLAVILNPRAKRRARRADLTGDVGTPRVGDGDGSGNHDGVMMKAVTPVVQQDKEKDTAPRTVP
ncbi:PQ-loop-domain-containing protein [Lactarius hengduanensis]|nr:PQ-loop-domain-containing protein [Lactarius hengduanensis]